jgi:hypothetical protein
MAVSKALLRLLRLRGMEEDRRRLALEAGLLRLRSLEKARDAASAKDRQGRELMRGSAVSGQLADRVSALAETEAGCRQVEALAPLIAASAEEGLRLHQQFAEKRTERRQAETLVDETLELDMVESERRSQQALDDWYGSRRFREVNGSKQDEESPTGSGRSQDSTSLPLEEAAAEQKDGRSGIDGTFAAGRPSKF